MKKLNELQKLLIVSAIVAVALALIALLPLFLANQPGWLIGVGIGSAIEILNILLLYRGSDVVLRTFKTGRFLIYYFLRMTLFLAGLVLTAIFGFGLNGIIEPIAAFKNSIWGALIAYTPMQIVVIVIMASNKGGFFNGMISISENNKKNDEEKKEE